MRKYLLIAYLFISVSLFASQITGVAPSYASKTLVLSTSHDGWHATKEILDSCVVAEDGSFSLSVDNPQTIQAQIDLGYYTGIIYIAQGKNYSINLPARKEISRKDKLNPYFKPQTILLSFNNLPIDDINRKISDFEDSFDSVWVDITQGPITTEKIDSAMNYLDEKYQSNDVFFSEYKHYRYALLVNLYSPKAPNLAIKNFFLPYKVNYDQPAFWESFEAIFTGFNMSDYLKENEELYDLSLLHQVLMDNLPRNYMDSVKTDNVKTIVSALRKDEVTVGYKPILGELTNLNGVRFSWSELYYKKVYIIVANSSLRESLSDIQYFKKMQDKYAEKCLFLLIFADEDKSISLKQVEKINKDFIFSIVDNPQLVSQLQIKTAPMYISLDKDGKIVKYPAEEPKHFVP
ncbi:MAG: hypothetical protein IKJ22_07130 [Paludibacteraceae bacterium]|nr:hypothetical protein [Paludibacteraceae bacterium]